MISPEYFDYLQRTGSFAVSGSAVPLEPCTYAPRENLFKIKGIGGEPAAVKELVSARRSGHRSEPSKNVNHGGQRESQVSKSHSSMPVPSIQGSILRLFLYFRKATTNWNAPVATFRTKAKWSDRFTRLPRDVEFKPLTAANVPVEWISPLGVSSQTVILYLHGGGGTLGWYNIERRMVAHIAQAATGRVLAVDYRLAPEHPFPAALEDCLGAYHWLLRDGTPARSIVITGCSMGGNLALATLMSLRDADDPLPAAAVCLSPITDLEGTGDSFTTKNDPAVSATFALSMARQYAGNQDMRAHLLSPHYGDLRGLPPLLIQVGGDEILLSDATRLADNARAASVDVNLVIWPKMWHAWQLFVPHLPEARQAVSDIGTFIRERTTAP